MREFAGVSPLRAGSLFPMVLLGIIPIGFRFGGLIFLMQDPRVGMPDVET